MTDRLRDGTFTKQHFVASVSWSYRSVSSVRPSMWTTNDHFLLSICSLLKHIKFFCEEGKMIIFLCG